MQLLFQYIEASTRKVKADKLVCRLIASGQRQIRRKWRTRLLLVGELTFNLDGSWILCFLETTLQVCARNLEIIFLHLLRKRRSLCFRTHGTFLA
ncbi:unnamed protein product [Brassica rapa subsp. narinosa]